MNDIAVRVIIEIVTVVTMTAAMLWLLLLPAAHRFGLLDHPMGRKDHAAPTPATGGLAIFLGILLTCGIFRDWTLQSLYFVTAASLLVLIGMLDDLRDLRWWIRVLAQCVAVLVMVYGGLRVEHVGQIVGMQTTGLGPLSVPFTIFATVGVINAINMSDGVDGLAGGIVLAALCMLGSAALYSGNFVLAEKLVIFAGAVAGFLVLNMRFPWQPRARVFMGNAGSALLGFVIAWASFRLTQNVRHPVTPVLAPWLVATPLIDCVALIWRRLARGQSPFRADREHMHHLMLDAGFTPTRLTMTLIATNLMLGLVASIALIKGVPQPVLVLAFMALLLGYFWLTFRRQRAVAAFAILNGLLTDMRRSPRGPAVLSVGDED